MLRVEARGAGRYAATPESFWGATTRGDLLARMALAAVAEAGASPTSLHASFHADAEPDREVAIRCDAPTGAQRRILLEQGGAPICDATFRFDLPAGRLTYQTRSRLDLPAPESLPPEAELGAREGWARYAVGPIESRRITPAGQVPPHEPAIWTGWLAPRKPLPDDPALHCAALVFLAEYRSHWAVERRLGPDFPTTALSLHDFALWIHRPARWDGFWLVTTRSDVGVARRCFSRREIATPDGELVASAAWELSARPLRV